MSFTKKFAWSGSAVLIATLFALALVAPQPASANVAITTLMTVTQPLTTNIQNGTGVPGALVDGVLTESGIGMFAVGNTLIYNAPAGWRFGPAPTMTATQNLAATMAVNGTGSQLTVTISAVSTGAAGVLTLGAGATDVTVSPLTSASVTGNITLDAASTVIANTNAVTSLAAAAVMGTITAGATFTAPYVLTLSGGGVLAADGSQVGAVTAQLRDSAGTPNIVTNTQVNFVSSIGLLGSTGTATTASIFTAVATGNAAVVYRGGGTAGGDTVVASVPSLSLVTTTTITLVTAVGTTAATQSVTAVANRSVGASTTTAGIAFFSSQAATDVTVRVIDGSSLGVNGQIMLVSVDKGAVAAGAAASCTGVTTRSVTATTATIATVVGRVQVTYCPIATQKGAVTLTSQNISTTTVANATTAITSSGRPDAITIVTAGTNITATVKDVDGNVVANGTPVRFTISSTVGAASNTCSVTTDGVASSVIALTAATGNLIVSTDWNEATSAATCTTAGSQNKAVVVALPAGTVAVTAPAVPAATPAATAATSGTLTSGTIPATGGFGLVVFGGGTLAQLVTATGCPAATAAIWATVSGSFVVYIPGTTISAVNAGFTANFPAGTIPVGTALVGKCL